MGSKPSLFSIFHFEASNNCHCDGKCSALTYSVNFAQNKLNYKMFPNSFPLPFPSVSPLCLAIIATCNASLTPRMQDA